MNWITFTTYVICAYSLYYVLAYLSDKLKPDKKKIIDKHQVLNFPETVEVVNVETEEISDSPINTNQEESSETSLSRRSEKEETSIPIIENEDEQEEPRFLSVVEGPETDGVDLSQLFALCRAEAIQYTKAIPY